MTFPESFLMKNSDANPKVSVLDRAENDVGFLRLGRGPVLSSIPCFCDLARLLNDQVLLILASVQRVR